MSVRSRTVLAAATALVAALPVTAHADPLFWAAEVESDQQPGVGTLCRMHLNGDPTAEPDTRFGTLSGGPVHLSDPRALAATLTCRIQRSTMDHTGSGPAVVGFGATIVTAGPQQVSMIVGDFEPVFLCAELSSASSGITYYWDGTNDAWSTNIGVDCTQVIAVQAP